MRLSVRTGITVVLALACLAVLPLIADDSQGKVVVTKPGVVFHKAGSGDLRGRGIERTVDAALEAGYSPCPICFAKELSMARNASENTGGAATAQSASTPPAVSPSASSTVTQPFGMHYAERYSYGSKDGGVKNPYDPLIVVVSGREEQGAYGDF